MSDHSILVLVGILAAANLVVTLGVFVNLSKLFDRR